MKRGGHRKFDDDTQNMLLAVLDGVRTKGEAEIIWIVASNFNSESMAMDEAMLRRFQMKVDFRLPNREERGAIIGHYLSQRAGKLHAELDLRHLAEATADVDSDRSALAARFRFSERVSAGSASTALNGIFNSPVTAL